MTRAIKIDQFSFSYGDETILKNISIAAEEGEYLAIIGANGAGKSTLIKCINRILIGGVGSIELFGKSLDQYSQKDLGKFMGYVPQTREQLLPYTVYEFVLMGRYPYLNPLSRVGREDRRIVDESLSTCGIDRFSQRMVNDLSGGERQKVYLAAALAQQPKVLLLDEPTAHLDPKYHMEIQNTICQISKDMNMTVLHVTHDLNYLLHWSQKIIALKNGEVCFYGTPDEVIKGDHLHKTFDTHFLVVPHPGDKRGIIIPEVNG